MYDPSFRLVLHGLSRLLVCPKVSAFKDIPEHSVFLGAICQNSINTSLHSRVYLRRVNTAMFPIYFPKGPRTQINKVLRPKYQYYVSIWALNLVIWVLGPLGYISSTAEQVAIFTGFTLLILMALLGFFLSHMAGSRSRPTMQQWILGFRVLPRHSKLLKTFLVALIKVQTQKPYQTQKELHWRV